MESCEVLVAGLGVMGSAAAHHAARLGARVIGIDQFSIPHDRGSSHGETRNIRQAIYESPGYVPLLRRAFALWRELEAESGRPLLRLTGRMMMGRPDGAAMSGALATARQYQLPIEVLSATEVRHRYPVFEPSDEMIGLFENEAGMLLVEPCLTSHLELARRRGAAIHFEETLLGWTPSGRGVEVRTSRTTYLTDRLVLALGAWLPNFLPTLPLTIERQVLLWFEPRARREDFFPEVFPIYLWELGDITIYGVPFWGDGLKMARHHGGQSCTADTVRRDIDTADIAMVRGPLERHMPLGMGRFLRGQTCVYTNTPDRHFIIDRHPAHEAVIVASPCSGHGFKYATAVGEAAAQLALDIPPTVDLGMFRAGRFSA